MEVRLTLIREECSEGINKWADNLGYDRNAPVKQHEHQEKQPSILNQINGKTPIYRASQGKGFRPGKSGGPVNRI